MFERFTDRARRAVVLAQEEARLLDHDYIGTEHILLGLIHEGEGVGAQAIESLGISLELVREHVETIIGRGKGGKVSPAHIPFTPRAKTVLELSLREALQIGHSYIGTEHILLGLVREGEGVAAQVLEKLGADLRRVRQTVLRLPSDYALDPVEGEWIAGEEGAETIEPKCPWCRRPLEETAVHRTFEAPSEEEDGEPVTVRVLFCKGCGRTLRTAMLT